jgi:hypothetical protein
MLLSPGTGAVLPPLAVRFYYGLASQPEVLAWPVSCIPRQNGALEPPPTVSRKVADLEVST